MLYNKSTATRFAYVFLLLAENSAKSCKKPTKKSLFTKATQSYDKFFKLHVSKKNMSISLVRLSFFLSSQKRLRERPETFNKLPRGFFLLKHASMLYVMVTYSGSV